MESAGIGVWVPSLWIFTEVSQLIYSTVTISIVLTFFCFLKIKSLEFI